MRAALIAAHIAALAGLLFAQSAQAFQVRPVRVDLGSRAAATQLMVHNPTPRPLLLQAEVFDWSQPAEAGDELRPSTALIVNPPILEIAPGASQVVRVGLRGPVEAGVERSYRLWLTQVATPELLESGVQLLMRVSLPVFVTGAGTPGPQPHWKLGENGVELRNSGLRHLQVRALKLTASDGRQATLGPCYALPAGLCRWALPAGWTPGALRWEADSDAGPLAGALDAPSPL
ncbi:MAG: molecular chaperone [Hydrogenophaga sp.]|uniref:Molecular chaperone n=1 Tax=Hydrogenophaga crocea TaxID=2716225 RepID=A0A6G8IED8_9BURK|nr:MULTISPECIES: fimbria/pilus periplasmic chaperone [Hydrogenophaga]MBL0943394.1 molecular chaperone [Hydrogenophaga sp.]QIM51479.1 molecular chaperone [Hydrogenophaga crocea]